MITETRIFVGETGTQVYDGWAGFIIGHSYSLTYSQEVDEVIIQIPHAPGRELRVSVDNFAKWFKKR
jgi:hypothetical protein